MSSDVGMKVYGHLLMLLLQVGKRDDLVGPRKITTKSAIVTACDEKGRF